MPKVKKGAGWISLTRDLTGDPGKVARVRDYYNSKGIYRLHANMTLPPLPDYIAKGGASGGRAAQRILGGGIEAQEGRPTATSAAPTTTPPAATGQESAPGYNPKAIQGGAATTQYPGYDPQAIQGGIEPLPTSQDTSIGQDAVSRAINEDVGLVPGEALPPPGSAPERADTPSFFEVMGSDAQVGTDPISFASQQAAGTIPSGPGGGSFFAEPPPVTAEAAFSAAWQSFVDAPSKQFTYNATKTRGKISLYEESGNRGHLPQTMSSAIAASIMNQFPLSEGLPAQSVQEFMAILDYTEAEPGIWVKDNPITSTAGYSTGFARLSGPRYSYSRGSVSRRNGNVSNYGAFSNSFLYNWNMGWEG